VILTFLLRGIYLRGWFLFKVFGVESVWWSIMVCNCMEMDGGGAMRFAGCRQSVRLDCDRKGAWWARHEAFKLWVSTLLLQTPLSVSSTRPFVLCATTRRSSTRHAISPSARTNNNLVLALQHLTRFFTLAVSSRLSLFPCCLCSL
jgi:hypothetical protein